MLPQAEASFFPLPYSLLEFLGDKADGRENSNLLK